MIILGSRGRPKELARFFSRFPPSIGGFVVLDNNDEAIRDYMTVSLPKGWSWLVYPKTTLVQSVNRAVVENIRPDTTCVAWMADDALPMTAGWDIQLASSAQPEGISYPEDRVYGRPSHFFVAGGLARKILARKGWFVPSCLKHLYFDTFYEDLGITLGRLTKREDVIVEHLHFSVRKAPYDATYKGRQTDGDKEAYELFRRNEMPSLIREIRGC